MGTARKILVIEDEDHVAEVIQAVLRENGYEVQRARDGQAGLKAALAEDGGISAVILDLMLPRVSGFEVLRQIRTASSRPGLPVLLLTGKAGEAYEGYGEAIGANAYLTKPFDIDVLVAKVNSLFE